MSKPVRITELTEDKLKSLTEQTTIVNGDGRILGVFLPPGKAIVDPAFPDLTWEELERRRQEPTRTWAEVRARLANL